MPRIPEQHDWVFFLVFGCLGALAFTLNIFNRDASVKDFLLQDRASAANIFPSWLLVSAADALLLAALLSKMLPGLPRWAESLNLFGFGMSRFGLAFAGLLILYPLRALLTLLLYYTTGNGERWERFYFVAGKFYFVLAFPLAAAVFYAYYSGVDGLLFFRAAAAAACIVFIFKNIFYLAHPLHILPRQWYYKILYLCTLQMAPTLALVKLLFL